MVYQSRSPSDAERYLRVTSLVKLPVSSKLVNRRYLFLKLVSSHRLILVVRTLLSGLLWKSCVRYLSSEMRSECVRCSRVRLKASGEYGVGVG